MSRPDRGKDLPPTRAKELRRAAFEIAFHARYALPIIQAKDWPKIRPGVPPATWKDLTDAQARITEALATARADVAELEAALAIVDTLLAQAPEQTEVAA